MLVPSLMLHGVHQLQLCEAERLMSKFHKCHRQSSSQMAKPLVLSLHLIKKVNMHTHKRLKKVHVVQMMILYAPGGSMIYIDRRPT